MALLAAVAQLCVAPADQFDKGMAQQGFTPFERNGFKWLQKTEADVHFEVGRSDQMNGCAIGLNRLPGTFAETRDALVKLDLRKGYALRLLMEDDGKTTDGQSQHMALIAGRNGPGGPTVILSQYLPDATHEQHFTIVISGSVDTRY